MYEHFEHTADLGLRATAPDLGTLFAEMAAGLFAAVVEDPTAVRPTTPVAVELPADEPALLLFDWLKALLYRFDVDHTLFARFEVAVDAGGLKGTAWGEPFDPARHSLSREVKAITYHDLTVEPTAGGWRAEVIVDI